MVMPAIYAAIGLLALVVWWYRYGVVPSPDGAGYLMAAAGHGAPTPFRWRILPWALGGMCSGVSPVPRHWSQAFDEAKGAVRLWTVVSWLALVASAALVGVYADARGVPGWMAVVLFVNLPWYRGLVRNPVLTDQVAMACALGAAIAPWWAAVPLSMLAGAANERAPLFAAVFAWSPVPLVGCCVPVLAAILTKHRELSWTAGHNDWRHWRTEHGKAQLYELVLPWGAALLAASEPSWQLAACCALGYGQLLVAHDRVRLYQWGAPLVASIAAGAMASLPVSVMALALVVHAVNPLGERQR
jgi:hypothetical protein